MARRSHTALNRRALAAAVASCFAAAANANPTGPSVVSGTATFNTLGNALTISNVPGTIIHWQGFSIQANEITRFLQQNASSAVLNRVTGGNLSQLLGQLLSNGRVFLINPSGIVVGQGAVIDVAAFVASSLNLSDADFLAGRYRFTNQIGAGAVVNQGTITTPSGGQVYLVAPNVENHGVITAPSGEVILAAGRSVEIVNSGTPNIRVELTAPDGEALNLGDVVAQAGRVGIYGAAVRNAGRVSANTAVLGENGKIVFKATGSVSLDAGSTAEATGPGAGEIEVSAGADVTVRGSARSGGTMTVDAGGDLTVTSLVSSGGAMTVNAAGALNLNGGGVQDAVLLSNGGQNITAQSINLTASNNRRANIENQGVGNQSITATAGGMNLIAQGGSGVAQIVNRAPGASQTLSMSGLLNVVGGTTGNPLGSRVSGVFQNAATGAQTITSSGITLQASPNGSNPAASSSSQIGAQGGDQTIDAGGGDINLFGAAGASNNASITGLGNQTITARNISLENGAGGTNSSAIILAAHQVITANGNITLTSRSSNAAGTAVPGVRIGGNAGPTDLQLNARNGGSLIVTGGTADNNGVGIGSGQVGTPFANQITINVDRDVILSAGTAPGTGMRIGSSSVNGTAGGAISITAGGEIQFNGTGAAPSQSASIRTLGDVSLSASRIVQTGPGDLIQAGKLTLKVNGDASLVGPNQVSTLSAPLVPAPPPAPPGTSQLGVGGNLTFNNNGSLNVADTVSSGGMMTLNVAGALNVNGNGAQDAVLLSFGGQDITAQSINLTASNNRRANIENQGVGNQSITATAGGMNLIALGGSGVAQIINRAPGASQALTMSGLLSVVGGTTGNPAGSRQSGVFQNATTGTQTITSSGITLQASPNGTNPAAASGAQISAQGGDQTIDAGGGDINLFAAAGAGNNASINALGNQTITARNINLENGTGGTNSSATILAAHQVITANGDVTLTSRASSAAGTGVPGIRIGGNGGATDLQLNARNGGSLIVSGGTADNNGVGIGSSGQVGTPPQANDIAISVDRDVILNAGTAPGTGVRIGSSSLNGTAGGTISITAGGEIQLNGASVATSQTATIRTLDDVSLSASRITETGAGALIQANKLTLKATGNADLGGPNQVSNLSAPGTASPLSPGVGGSLNFSNLGDLNVTSVVSSSGPMTLDVAGTLNVTASAPGEAAALRSSGGQTIRAHSLSLAALGGGSAVISNGGSGAQNIAVAGGGAGTGIDVRSTGSFAQIANTASASQTITAADADFIRVNAIAGSAQINASGAQTISITGGGANRISIGSAGASGFSQVTAPTQSVVAGEGTQAGGIDIIGANGISTAVGFISFAQPGNTQTISTSGTLKITGGNASNPTPPPPSVAPTSFAGISNNSNGLQRITAAGIEMQGGLSGNGNTAFILSSGGNVAANAGDQEIKVGAGGIRITGGELGSNNRAGITTLASQTIQGLDSSTGRPDIAIAGGASGGAAGNNNAFIQAGGSGRTQTINAGTITLSSGAAGVDNSASINAAKQTIRATGDVLISGGGSTGNASGSRIGGLGGAAPSATDLFLEVGGNLVMTGGSATNNAAAIGSGAASATPPSRITVQASGDVILNSGSGAGARIGAPLNAAAPGAGEISISAGRSIQLNGTTQAAAIRSLDGVTLAAGTMISEGANGFIQAGALTTISVGDTSLTGPNQVGSFFGTSTAGSVTLNNAGPLVIAGINAANAALIRAASVHGSGAISTGTGFTVDVSSVSELDGVISGAGGLNKDGVGALTLGAVNTYAGDTNVNLGTLALGAPDQTTSGNINIAAGATFRGSPGTYTNAGVIAGNGTVDVAATSFTNSGTLRPGGSGAIGTLTVQGDATLNGTLDIEAQGAGSYDVLAVTGAATLGGALNVTPINGYAPQGGDTIVPLTFASRSGALDINPADWLATYNPANLALTFSQLNRWIAASGNWDLASNWSLGHVPTNFERVLIDVPGSQFVTVSRGSQAADRLTSNENFILSGGSLNLGGPSTFNGSFSLLGGELKGNGNVTVNGAFVWAGGRMSGTGAFLTSAGSVSLLSPLLDDDLVLGKSWTNRGTAQWIGLQPGSIKGSGSIRNEGTFSFAGRNAVVETPFSNSGTLNVDTNVDLKLSSQNAGAINIASGVKLKVHGTYTNLGRLAGKGTLDLDGGKLVNLGTLAPGANGGNGIGTFTVVGDFQQGATGVLEIDLGGTRVGQYDVLNIDGKATLGGTLFARAANGYVPRRGDDFKLVTYKSRVGTFEFLLPPAGFALDADYAKKFASFELD